MVARLYRGHSRLACWREGHMSFCRSSSASRGVAVVAGGVVVLAGGSSSRAQRICPSSSSLLPALLCFLSTSRYFSLTYISVLQEIHQSLESKIFWYTLREPPKCKSYRRSLICGHFATSSKLYENQKRKKYLKLNI